ncbi:HAD hydrolase family protein, partial [Rothia sp. (in: high G+C Gram-positive bacteria)]
MPEIFAASSSANPRVTPRLIAVDMDGTFLTDAKTFDTDRFERILPRLQAHGIYFV